MFKCLYSFKQKRAITIITERDGEHEKNKTAKIVQNFPLMFYLTVNNKIGFTHYFLEST